MTQSIYLQGSEELCRSAGMIKEAASEIRGAVHVLESALAEHRRWQDDWLQRFEQVITDAHR